MIFLNQGVYDLQDIWGRQFHFCMGQNSLHYFTRQQFHISLLARDNEIQCSLPKYMVIVFIITWANSFHYHMGEQFSLSHGGIVFTITWGNSFHYHMAEQFSLSHGEIVFTITRGNSFHYHMGEGNSDNDTGKQFLP